MSNDGKKVEAQVKASIQQMDKRTQQCNAASKRDK